jgi:hypothetical protein
LLLGVSLELGAWNLVLAAVRRPLAGFSLLREKALDVDPLFMVEEGRVSHCSQNV